MTSFLDGPTPRAFAHRGWHIGSLAGCENSMAAFVRAAAEGYRYLETDVHLSADGVLVAFHDHFLDRVTDASGRISRTRWSQISRARIGGREPVPAFEDVLGLLGDRTELRLNVDPKTDAAVEPLLAALTSAGLAERVCIGSFSDHRLRRVAHAAPGIARSLGPASAGRLALAARLGTSGLKVLGRQSGAVAAQVPLRYGPVPVVTAAFMLAAHRCGLEVHVWTVDDATRMRALLDLGVDGVMTDRPDILRDVLTERGLW